MWNQGEFNVTGQCCAHKAVRSAGWRCVAVTNVSLDTNLLLCCVLNLI